MTSPNTNAATLTPEIIRRAIRTIAAAFEQNYVDPAVAADMANHLITRLEEGAFDQSESLNDLAYAATSELHSVCHDHHVSIAPRSDLEDKISCEQKIYQAYATDNYGFRKIEMLPGTIGYLDIRLFCPVSMAGDTAVAAMRFVSGANALIFDLRNHGGGEDDMIRLLAGYLFDEPVELCSIHHRGERGIQQSKTADYVPGSRLANVPVYILTSGRTFSAAEAFAYNLQQRERAVIVGETTRGGGHTVMFLPLPEYGLELGIPEGNPVNPISKTNWEGTGVIPDLAVDEDKALAKAHQHALHHLKESINHPDLSFRIAWALAKAQAECEPVTVSGDVLASYAGFYGKRNRVRVEDGVLYILHEGFPEFACTPLAEDLFEYEGGSSRVRFVSENDAITTAIFQLETGQEFVSRRT